MSARHAPPTDVLHDAIRGFEEEGSAALPFLPSRAFAGARPGYFFSKGREGVG